MAWFRGDKSRTPDGADEAGREPVVSSRYCTTRLTRAYAHIGIYDCRMGTVHIAKRNEEAMRLSHAVLITGSRLRRNSTAANGGDGPEGSRRGAGHPITSAVGTVWKDRFLCFWFHPPYTSSGDVLGYPIDWSEGHLLVRIDPWWDYDRQRLIPRELTDQSEQNVGRQVKHGQRILAFYEEAKLKFPVSMHLIAQRAADSLFYVRRVEAK